MSLLDRLERHFGRFAVPGLIRYVVGLNALTYLLGFAAPGYLSLLNMDPALVMQGQIWRLITWIFIPESMSPIFVAIALLVLWRLGEGLESAWGTFRLNVFYFVGVLGCTVAAFFGGGMGSNFFLNLTILFAFATIYPDFQFLLFFIIPLKVKWLAWLSAALFVLPGLLLLPWAAKLAILVSLANYFLFFGPEFIRGQRERAKIAERRQRFEAAKLSDATLHRCALCERTEVSDPRLEFRMSADGEEYCLEHLPGAKPPQP